MRIYELNCLFWWQAALNRNHSQQIYLMVLAVDVKTDVSLVGWCCVLVKAQWKALLVSDAMGELEDFRGFPMNLAQILGSTCRNFVLLIWQTWTTLLNADKDCLNKKFSIKVKKKKQEKRKMAYQKDKNLVHIQQQYSVSFYEKTVFISWFFWQIWPF